MSRLVHRALGRYPDERYGSALELADAIADLLDAPTRRRARRRAGGYAVFAALMAFAVVLLGRQLATMVRDLPAMVEERLGAGSTGELPQGPPPPRLGPTARDDLPATPRRFVPADSPDTPVELPSEQLELEEQPVRRPAEADEPIRVRREDTAATHTPVVLVTDED